MKLTAELSLYPLHENYVDIIRAFIETVNGRAGVSVITNAMSTQLRGDHDTVMALVGDALQTSYERYGKQVLVCKLIPEGPYISQEPR